MAQMETEASMGQKIVQYFSGDPFFNSLISAHGNWTWWSNLMRDGPPNEKAETEAVARQCVDLFKKPDEALEAISNQDEAGNNELLRTMQGCIRLLGSLFKKNQGFKNSKTSECLVELLLWMLKSPDGELKTWQKELQNSLDEFMQVTGLQFSKELSQTERDLLDKFKSYSDKDVKEIYNDFSFLKAYVKDEMPKKRRIIRETFKDKLVELSKGTDEFRVLSLGCGPGSDLLAVLDCWAESRSQRPIACVGVDQQWWPRGAFLEKKITLQLKTNPAISLIQQDIKSFVYSTEKRFNLVLLSFVGVGNQPQRLLTAGLQSLLTSDGLVFVVDKYSDEVLKLTSYKFRPTQAGLLNVQFSGGIGHVIPDDDAQEARTPAALAFQPSAAWLMNDATRKPIMIGLSMQKNVEATMRTVRVFYVAETFIDVTIHQERNMTLRMKLDAIVSFAQVDADLNAMVQKLKQTYPECTWTCEEADDLKQGNEADKYESYLCFIFTDKQFVLLGKKTSPSEIELGKRRSNRTASLEETKIARNPVPPSKVAKREDTESGRRPARSTCSAFDIQDDGLLPIPKQDRE